MTKLLIKLSLPYPIRNRQLVRIAQVWLIGKVIEQPTQHIQFCVLWVLFDTGHINTYLKINLNDASVQIKCILPWTMGPNFHIWAAGFISQGSNYVRDSSNFKPEPDMSILAGFPNSNNPLRSVSPKLGLLYNFCVYYEYIFYLNLVL